MQNSSEWQARLMAVTMELEESASDSKIHRDSTSKKELRPSSAVSLSKSEHGPGLCHYPETLSPATRFVNHSNITVHYLIETSTSTEQLKQYKSWVSNERWNELKKIADNAMRDRKVFMIKGGGFPAVRRSLLERGWIEKYESHKVFQTLPPGVSQWSTHSRYTYNLIGRTLRATANPKPNFL